VAEVAFEVALQKKLEEIGHEVWAISHLERRGGYVRVVDTRFDYWLSEKEIKLKGFKVENWQNFLPSHADDLLGYYANDPGLNLRIAPDPGGAEVTPFRCQSRFRRTPPRSLIHRHARDLTPHTDPGR
jgi:hypothetical protein